MKPAFPLLLTFNGGYVDVAGFLALQGLFTAHVTGNFATLGASIALGTSGVIAKLIALPVFCLAIALIRTLGHVLRARTRPVVRPLLIVQMLLLGAGACLAIRLGPFRDGDAWPALLTGMILVAAMAMQNAVHRIHLPKVPPSTVMTSTVVQLMLDVADVMWGMPDDQQAMERARLLRIAVQVAVFVLGCAAAALLYIRLSVWCFLLPPVLVVAALITAGPEPD